MRFHYPGIQRHVEVRPGVGVNQERVSSRPVDAHAVTDSSSRVAAIAAAGKSGKRETGDHPGLGLHCPLISSPVCDSYYYYYYLFKGGSLLGVDSSPSSRPCL